MSCAATVDLALRIPLDRIFSLPPFAWAWLFSHVQLFAHQAPLVHGTFQARIHERVTVFSSRGSSQPRDRTRLFWSPVWSGGLFTPSAAWEAPHPLLNLGLKMKTNLYDDCQKDLEIDYDLLTLSLFKPFHLLKATDTMERILGIKTEQTLVQILALPS